MDPEEFVRALRLCPDEELPSELGIYDNVVFLMSADFDKVAKDLRRKYPSMGRLNMDLAKSRDCSFDYQGVMRIRMTRTITDFMLTRPSTAERTQAEEEHCARQLRDYSMGLILQYQVRTEERLALDSSAMPRTLAKGILEIHSYIKKRKFPACLPLCIGDAHKGDVSRIVYYEYQARNGIPAVHMLATAAPVCP